MWRVCEISRAVSRITVSLCVSLRVSESLSFGSWWMSTWLQFVRSGLLPLFAINWMCVILRCETDRCALPLLFTCLGKCGVACAASAKLMEQVG